MKKLMALSLLMMVLLAACGNKVDGTYEGEGIRIGVDSEKEEVIFTDYNEDVSFKGLVDEENQKFIFNDFFDIDYKMKGSKLIIENPLDGKEVELMKY